MTGPEGEKKNKKAQFRDGIKQTTALPPAVTFSFKGLPFQTAREKLQMLTGELLQTELLHGWR